METTECKVFEQNTSNDDQMMVSIEFLLIKKISAKLTIISIKYLVR